MEDKNVNKSWGWAIPDTLLERTDLDMYEKVLIAIMGRLGALEKSIYPRQKWLASKMGITERGVRKILERLKEKGIVNYEGRKWKIALYSLRGTAFLLSEEQRSCDSEEQRSSHNKEIHSKEIQIKNQLAKQVLQPRKDQEVFDLINKFKPVNPSFNTLFNNKTQRAALERMIRQHGFSQVEKLIGMLPKIFGKPYAPVITTPHLLEQKLGNLLAFLKQRSEEKINFVDLKYVDNTSKGQKPT